MPKLYAYEVDCFGNGDTIWEIYTESDEHFSSIPRDFFGDFLDFFRVLHYDVYINTYESWEAMDHV